MDLKADFTKTFPGGPTIQAAFNLDLEIFHLTVLFGPSGCGKTTVLRCIAGLETPDSGSIQAGEVAWFQAGQGTLIAAPGRNIGYVFQESVLFPHLTVKGNIAYGLKGWTRKIREHRVEELIALMGLTGLVHRRPTELSGGEKQRVALARALAPKPRLVLLDEPFASLDHAAAEELRHSLRQTLHTLEVPTILVTHNPVEALALGDRMILMAQGRIVQEGPPAMVLASLNDVSEDQMGAVVRTQVVGKVEGLLRLSAAGVELFAPDPGGDFQDAYACIRGEGVSIERGPHGVMTQRNRLTATISRIEPAGALTRIYLDAGFPLQALVTTWACMDLQLHPGQKVTALIKASAIGIVPIES